MTITRKLAQWLIQAALIAFISGVLLEAMVAASFRYPAASPIPLTLTRYLHMRFDRNVIQVLPECARYDSTVTYTLRPGRCIFASREFSNEYRINTLGVRDDEASLAAPEAVFLGDSLTMGWGVDQDAAFPSRYERATGRRALNAGISSYGTVRELRLLERIDRSALKNLIIQYNENDTLENSQLVERPPFTTLTKDQYQRTVDEQFERLRYLPGKYAFNVLVQLQAMLRGGSAPAAETIAASAERQAELFVRVLEQTTLDPGGARVTVLAARSDFLDQVRAYAERSTIAWVRTLDVLCVDSIAAIPGAYYVLDDHPTALGHEAIAGLLVKHLTQ